MKQLLNQLQISAEAGKAAEKLSGNVVKEEFYKGQLYLLSIIDREYPEQPAEPTGAEWTQKEPTQVGVYWFWQGDEYGAPIAVNVGFSGSDNRCFVMSAQYGWTRAQTMDELKGTWWKRCHVPNVPTLEERSGDE